MACCLFDTKPLHTHVLTYCQLGPQKQILVKFKSKYNGFHSRKFHLEMSPAKWRPSCLDLFGIYLILPACLWSWNTRQMMANPHPSSHIIETADDPVTSRAAIKWGAHPNLIWGSGSKPWPSSWHHQSIVAPGWDKQQQLWWVITRKMYHKISNISAPNPKT